MPDPLDELGPQLARRRRERALSVREAASEAGVPPATFSRVENGRMPDLGTFRQLVSWLGVPPESFFGEMTPAVSTPAFIAEHLRSDPALDPDNAETIVALVEDLYASLARREEQRLAVHLRAAKTFTPLALQSLTSMLGDMQKALHERYAG